MKKIICIFVTICVVIFIACDNKNEVMTNEKEPLVNPYDYIGEIHNDGLSEYLRLIRNSEITDIENFTDDFAVTFIAKEIVRKERVGDQVVLKKNLKSTVSHVKKEFSVKSLRSGSLLKNSDLTDFQKSTINAIFAALDATDENAKERILTIESTVLSSEKSLEEKELVLCAIAIAKYSFDFWTEYIENNDPYLRNSVVEDINIGIGISDDGLTHPTAEKLVKADLSGAIIGGIRGAVKGGVTGLVFGPGGLVLTIAGSAVGGGLWASAGTAGIFGWIW